MEKLLLNIFLKKLKSKNTLSKLKMKLIYQILLKKHPVIFVSGHFANFELMSMTIVNKNIKLATIYRPLNNIFESFYGIFKKEISLKIKLKKVSME